jgi:altronate dehydratase
MDFEAKIFGNKSFSDILKNIYDNSREKEKQIKDLITGLKPLVVDTQSALMVVPLIKEYLDVSVKNDDSLIKMAGIVQRAMANAASAGDDGMLSEAEREQLMNAVQNIDKEVSKPITTDVNKDHKD